jgi:hypothetical protein
VRVLGVGVASSAFILTSLLAFHLALRRTKVTGGLVQH